MKKKRKSGTITPALLVITSAFLVIIYALLTLLTYQFRNTERRAAFARALNIAEAGVNYYRWHLAHEPEDFQDGTGQPGPYIHSYSDPQGNVAGYFSLEIIPPENGSSIVTIKSTGWSVDYPDIKRTITAQYGRRSLARFSFLQNSSTWFGENITVNGEIHSNNGIRMDGTNTSRVTSAKETYLCGSETGCSPPQTRPGVWGSGGDKDLWEFPVDIIDFGSISFDFQNMKSSAQESGLYLENSGSAGYHLVFNSNGTVDIFRVTRTGYYYGYDADDGCHRLYQRIYDKQSIGSYNLNNLPLIFIEDNIWIEGIVRGRTTVVAARFPIETYETNIWISNNLKYQSYDGSDVLGLIAQNDIYFSRDIPNDFAVDASLLAQRGKIIRHGYFWWCGGSTNAVRNSLTIRGSIISFNKSYWNYGDSPPSSGFITREIYYDGNLLFMPPPFFPVSGDYEFISWKEE